MEPEVIVDQLTEKEIRESFVRAFFAKRMTYTSALVYDDPYCTPIMNDPKLEPRLIENP